MRGTSLSAKELVKSHCYRAHLGSEVGPFCGDGGKKKLFIKLIRKNSIVNFNLRKINWLINGSAREVQKYMHPSSTWQNARLRSEAHLPTYLEYESTEVTDHIEECALQS